MQSKTNNVASVDPKAQTSITSSRRAQSQSSFIKVVCKPSAQDVHRESAHFIRDDVSFGSFKMISNSVWMKWFWPSS